MRQALRLAERGRGRTSPNPMVGAVIVKAGKIVGSGFHHKAGKPHAEVNAILAAGARARGATLYVNLEPCCHRTKRTPPCTDAIIKSGIRKVVLATRDPNPQVNGRGITILRKAGISIIKGILEKHSLTINEIYIKYITKRIPFVILKSAMTLDGKIALGNTVSQWITGEQARRMAHRLRNHVDAVLVGIQTVLADNPRLTTRLPGKRGKDPHRIVLDSRLRIPLNARVLSPSSSATTFIATTRKAPRGKIRKLHDKGAVVLVLPDQDKRVNMKSLVKELGRLGMTSLMIEGGAEVNASALQSGIVDKLIWFIAPRLMGGKEAVGVIGGSSPEKLKETIPVRSVRCRQVGNDLMIEGYLA
jgi:diaminohydroxyphosphoribosylaminopyrimidine deaminase / 5-amino-6-(5-phosphoribosylamino)uracil reductase